MAAVLSFKSAPKSIDRKGHDRLQQKSGSRKQVDCTAILHADVPSHEPMQELDSPVCDMLFRLAESDAHATLVKAVEVRPYCVLFTLYQREVYARKLLLCLL